MTTPKDPQDPQASGAQPVGARGVKYVVNMTVDLGGTSLPIHFDLADKDALFDFDDAWADLWKGMVRWGRSHKKKSGAKEADVRVSGTITKTKDGSPVTTLDGQTTHGCDDDEVAELKKQFGALAKKFGGKP